MYESFFELKVKPFDLLPNPEFLYLSRSHKKAHTYLDYAVKNRAGFILLTGEIGSGKTTLIRDIMNKYKQNFTISRIVNTRVNFEQLLAMINADFGLSVGVKDKFELLHELNEFLVAQYGIGNRAILIIDEAQNLNPEVLEELRLLSNLETDSVKLLHIILAGQPELRQTLAMPQLLQLRQRFSCFCHLLPLEQEEIEPYILHRLQCAGNRQAAIFTPAALDLIWRYSRGIPRLVNTLCDFLMLLAFAEGQRVMTDELVHAVLVDLDFENCYWGDASVPIVNHPANQQLLNAAKFSTPTDSAVAVKEVPSAVTAPLEKTEPCSPQRNDKFTTAPAVACESPAKTQESKKNRGWFGFLFREA